MSLIESSLVNGQPPYWTSFNVDAIYLGPRRKTVQGGTSDYFNTFNNSNSFNIYNILLAFVNTLNCFIEVKNC